MSEMYGLDPQRMVMREMPTGNISTVVHVDLADVMRAYCDSMCLAFQMGQAANRNDEIETMASNGKTSCLPCKKYIGIYDDSGYGVYCDLQKLEASRPYWKAEATRYCEFSSYEEALAFAKNGVATYMGIPVHAIPNPTHSIDWRQIVQKVTYGNPNDSRK